MPSHHWPSRASRGFRSTGRAVARDRLGLQKGDQLVALNGEPVRSYFDFRWKMTQAYIGEGQSRYELGSSL